MLKTMSWEDRFNVSWENKLLNMGHSWMSHFFLQSGTEWKSEGEYATLGFIKYSKY